MTNESKEEARLDALEMRLTFQDQTIDALNTAITEQWSKIDALSRQVAELRDRLREAETSPPATAESEPPPPHY